MPEDKENNTLNIIGIAIIVIVALVLLKGCI